MSDAEDRLRNQRQHEPAASQQAGLIKLAGDQQPAASVSSSGGKLRRFLLVILALVAVVLLAAIFAAYQHPAMLIDFSNLIFCG